MIYPEKKKEVDEAVFGARVFYFMFHFLGILVVLVYDNEISRDLKQFKLLYPLFVVSLFLISVYFFMTCGNNPGFADRSPIQSFKSVDQENLSLNSQEDIEDQKQKNLSQFKSSDGNVINDKNIIKESQSDNNDIDLELQDIKDKNTDKIQLNDQIQHSSSKQPQQQQQEEQDEDDINEVVKKFYCPKCNLRQQYRTKHCDLCGRCIKKFDHHCFWIGGCVGELNHRSFWAFLVFQTLFLMCVFKVFWNGMDNYSRRDPRTGEWIHENAYGAYAIFAFICFLFIMFTGILGAYHTFLILSNQTTWEHASRSKITYTQIYPKGYYPFNKGVINNIKTIFCHNNQFQEWKLPDLQQAEFEAQNTFNWCENEYYSCC